MRYSLLLLPVVVLGLAGCVTEVPAQRTTYVAQPTPVVVERSAPVIVVRP